MNPTNTFPKVHPPTLSIPLAKKILYLSNIFCWVAGLALIATGLFCKVKVDEIDGIFKMGAIYNFPNSMIFLGVLMIFFSLMGSIAVRKDDECMLLLYSTFMSVLVVWQLILLVIIWTADPAANAERQFNQLWSDKESPEAILAIQRVERLFECCGKEGAKDWIDVGNITITCCQNGYEYCELFNAFPIGCNKAMQKVFNSSIRMIGWSSILFSLVEILALISARCLDNSIWKRKRRLKRSSIF